MTGQDRSAKEEDIALAGEYVLRLLGPEETRQFEKRLSDEPALAAHVANWETRLAGLHATTRAVAPPQRLKAGIDAALEGGERPAAGSGFLQGLLALGGRRRGLWAGLAAGLLIGALFLGSLTVREPVSLPGPQLASELASENGGFALAVLLDPDSGNLTVQRTRGSGAREGRDLELWLIAGERPPISLGLLPEEDRGVLKVPKPLRPLFDGAVLAVSDEPDGGSPTGLPTGEVIASGSVALL